MFVETAFEMIEGAEPIYPLEIVRRMRDQRASSIQTPVSFRASLFRYIFFEMNQVFP